METPTNASELGGEIVSSWASARQIRIWVGRLQGRKGLLPESTWHRWREQLSLRGDRLYSPDQVRLILQFCQWLGDGGTVEGFQKSYGIQTNSNSQGTNNDAQQRQHEQPQQQRQQPNQQQWDTAPVWTIRI